MGFLRRLFRPKKPTSDAPDSSKDQKQNKKWSFIKSNPNAFRSSSTYAEPLDANKHAIAVAAATAAVAEAALAAAHAAAEVVRLTSGGGVSAHVSGNRRWEDAVLAAAIKIQSAFRGYLARRALRALKALVKLQALVRGHIVRKQTADMLRRMQTLVRLQARARASRSHLSESLHYTSKSTLSRPRVQATSDRNEHKLRARSSKFDPASMLKRCGSNSNFRNVSDIDTARVGSTWLDPWMEENLWSNCHDSLPTNINLEDEKTDKILEIDTWKPHLNSQRLKRTSKTSQHFFPSDYNNQTYIPYESPSKHSTKSSNPGPILSLGEAVSLSSLKYPMLKDETVLKTTESSPQVQSASSRPGSSSRRGPFTPARSECSWGYFSNYSGFPSYMANTQSSKAKVRSHSAPKQRLEFEKCASSIKSVQGYWDGWSHSDGSFSQEAESTNKAYRAGGRLTRVGSNKLR